MPKQRLVAPRREIRGRVAGARERAKDSNLDVRHDRTFKRLSALVSKEEWKEVLGYFPESAKAEKLLMLLSDPQLSRVTLAKLAVQSGLSTAELTLFFNNSRKQEGIVRMSQKLPDIMEGTAEDALPKVIPCAKCGGEGKVKDNICRNCHGEGSIRVSGDIEKTKLIFDAVGLTGKRGPSQLNLINVSGSQSLETRVGLAQQLLAEPSVEGEVVSAEDIEEPATDG